MMAFLGNVMGALLSFVYDVISKIGVEPENVSYYAMAIILTTILFKLILLPLNLKQARTTKKMNEIQPELAKIQEKYKNDPQTQQIKLQALYKEHDFNPMGGCLLPLIQLPILMAFLRVFREPQVYAFTDPAMYKAMNKSFFWIKNLENVDPLWYGLPLIAAITTFLMSKAMQPPTPETDGKKAQPNPQQESMKMMNMMLPFMIFFSAKQFPAGLALYWVVNNIISVIQHLIVNKV